MISQDPLVFDKKSNVYKRMKEYSSLFNKLDVIVMARGKKSPAIHEGNLSIHSALSSLKIFSLLKALSLTLTSASLFRGKETWISAQDPYIYGLVALIASKIFKTKLQIQVHFDILGSRLTKRNLVRGFFRGMISKWTYKNADSVRVVREKIKEDLLSLDLISKKSKINVLPIYVDLAQFENHKISYDLHKKYPEFKKIIIFVGRLEEEKNPDMALVVFQKILRVEPECGMVILGEGSKKEWLLHLISHLGLEGRVKFEGWSVDVLSAYKTSDLMIVTSHFEGYGMAMLEAATTELPIVSTDVGIASDIGAQVTSFDPGEMALESLNALSVGRRKYNLEAFRLTKESYLQKFKESFN